VTKICPWADASPETKNKLSGKTYFKILDTAYPSSYYGKKCFLLKEDDKTKDDDKLWMGWIPCSEVIVDD
jgi:hypothetical protein